MNRTIKAAIGIIFVLIITFSAIHICQNIGKRLKKDISAYNLYTLSDGTKAIIKKLSQPITMKLYYAETAAIKGSDQIRYFNDYYRFIRSLLEEYVAASNGMITLEVIDPRPYSDDELQAMRYGLKRYQITEEENFFFGLVVQTQFGAEKIIPFFSPDRQNFIEYDISYLVDSAITRQKTKIGIMSSLPIMGDDMSGYMAQMMMMQGQKPKPPWAFVQQLKGESEVTEIKMDVTEINNIDILLVIHPKNISDNTLFAIDQFILKGGRALICVDPFCFVDKPNQMMMQTGYVPNSNLPKLFDIWGIDMPERTFAGDRNMALLASMTAEQRPEKVIGFLGLTKDKSCFNPNSVITGSLNEVRMLFSGALKVMVPSDTNSPIKKTPLLMTTNRGNTWKVDDWFDLTMGFNPQTLMKRFSDGNAPVVMGYLLTGKFQSGFPDGIEIEVNTPAEPNKTEAGKTKKHITGLTVAKDDCAVVIISDVDFLSDMIAYQDTFFGKMASGDNSALLMNVLDDLKGSGDLISIRSRGNFRRPFNVVDEIEKKAEAETAEEEEKINTNIANFQKELESLKSSEKQGDKEVVGGTVVAKIRDLESKIREAEKKSRDIKKKRREKIEQLGNSLRTIDMLAAPVIILIVAIVLGVRRSVRRRHYISHASDA